MKRRDFLKDTSKMIGGVSLLGLPRLSFSGFAKEPLYKISIAQWSLHRTLAKGDLDNLDFAYAAKQNYGIYAVEYVNTFFKTKAQDKSYLAEMKKRAEGEGVRSLLIMCDGEGRLGDPEKRSRIRSGIRP